MAERATAVAIIERDEHVLMVRERVRSSANRFDGPEYWTLPGGAIYSGENPQDAVVRKVCEKVSLRVLSAREVAQVAYPFGSATVFRVAVAAGEPCLGDNFLDRWWPRTVGFDWIPMPALGCAHSSSPVPLVVYNWCCMPVAEVEHAAPAEAG